MVKMKMVMVRDDAVGNLWFIGQPIDVYYQYKAIGIYQIGKIFLLLLVQHFYLEILNYMMLILLMVPNPNQDRVLTSKMPDWFGTVSLNMNYKI
jgi:hypothetical protein